MAIVDRARAVRTRDDFVALLGAVVADLQTHPEDWTNRDLQSFLEAMAAWGEDMAGFYSNRGEDLANIAPWRVMADMIMAALIYE